MQNRNAAPAGTTVEPVSDRLLKAAKTLFAQKGYDNASTAAIARAAGSSESQLVKHFGGKQGLLAAVFERGWNAIGEQLDQSLPYAQDARSRLGMMAHTVVTSLEGDPELKLLFLFEGRRMRSERSDPSLSEGFLRFIQRLDTVLSEAQTSGQFRPGVNPQAVRSALLGMVEGLLRDHYMAQRTGFPANYPLSDLPQLLSLAIDAFLDR